MNATVPRSLPSKRILREVGIAGKPFRTVHIMTSSASRHKLSPWVYPAMPQLSATTYTRDVLDTIREVTDSATPANEFTRVSAILSATSMCACSEAFRT